MLLDEFQVTPLHKRRTIAQQIFIYKTVNYIFDNPEFLQLISFNVKRNIFRKREFFQTSIPRTLAHKQSPMMRMCITYNIISEKHSLDFCKQYYDYVRELKSVL